MPNHGSALYEDQSEIDALDWKIVTDGIFGRGCFTGGVVSAQTTPDGSVLVSAGTARIGDADVPFSSGSVSVISGSANADGSTASAANATKPRYDLIVVNATGTLGVVHGDNPADPVFPDFIVNPVFPTWATTQVVCATVYVVPGLTAIATGHITQKTIRLNKNAFTTLLHSMSDVLYHSGEISNAQHGIRSIASAHAFSHITGTITAAQGLGLPQALTGAVSASRYVGGTASVAPTTGAFLAGDWVTTLTGKIYICTVAGSPGTWVQAGGGTVASGGALTADVTTSETTTSTSYTDVATFGPSVAVTVGASGLLLVTVSATMSNSSTNANYMAFSGTGVTAVDVNAALNNFVVSNPERAQRTTLLTGLTPGSLTLSAKYKTTAGTATFSNRRIIAVPLG